VRILPLYSEQQTFTYCYKQFPLHYNSFVLERSAAQMAPGPSEPPTSNVFYKSVYLEVIAALHYNNRYNAYHACALSTLCFIKGMC